MAYSYTRNVPDFRNEAGEWVKTKVVSPHERIVTLSAGRWSNLNSRCSRAYQSKNPTYVGVTNDFLSFQHFVEWSVHQFGYEFNTFDLDKDILEGKNKSYSESTCVFVPREVNVLFRTVQERELPVGCYYCNRDKLYYSNFTSNGRSVRIGSSKTLDGIVGLHTEYRNQSIIEILSKYSETLDPRVISKLESLISK